MGAFNIKSNIHHFGLMFLRSKPQSLPLFARIQLQVARGCWGSPLALKLIGTSLHGQHSEAWQKMKRLLSEGRSILVSTSDDLLNRLQKVLDDVLEDKPIIKECFMDLGLFPQDQMVPVAPLLDMWTELNQLDDGGMNIVRELNNLNLVNLVVTRYTN